VVHRRGVRAVAAVVPWGGGVGGCGPVSGSRGWECRTVPWRVKVMAAVVVLRVGSSRRRGRPGGGLRTAARGWDGGGAAVGAVAEVVGVADLDGGVGRRGTGSRRRGRRVPHAVTRRRWRRGGRRPGRGRSRRSGRAARWRRRPAGGPLDRHGVTGGRWGGAGACHMHRTYIRCSDLSRPFRMLWLSRGAAGAEPRQCGPLRPRADHACEGRRLLSWREHPLARGLGSAGAGHRCGRSGHSGNLSGPHGISRSAGGLGSQDQAPASGGAGGRSAAGSRVCTMGCHRASPSSRARIASTGRDRIYDRSLPRADHASFRSWCSTACTGGRRSVSPVRAPAGGAPVE
jgi:hypothetical protein